MPVVTDYTALLSGKYWNGIEVTGRPAIVTYSFPTSAPSYISNVAGFNAATVSSFQPFTAAMQTQARTALSEWAAASGIVFLEVAPGQGDINFQLVDLNTTSGPSYAGSGGIAFYPFGNWTFFSYPYFTTSLDDSGDVFMNSQFISGGEVNYGTLLHEIGHALGLKHPTEIVVNFAAQPNVTHDQVLSADDPLLTIMATVGESGGGTPSLKTLDRNAVAFLYGASGGGRYTTSASGTNSVSTWVFDAVAQKVTQTGFATADAIRGTSITDEINGLAGADQLFGLAGNDTLNGGAGDDSLYGGQGINQLAGGIDNDFYLLENPTDIVTENVNEGYDSVVVNFSYTLSPNVEQLQLFGANLTGTGNTIDNVIFGDGTFQNTLNGVAGSDYIVAGGANDLLNGGDESDSLYGQGGDDVLVGGTGDDVIDGGTGDDTLQGGAGNDSLTGDIGNDLLDGFDGNTDTLIGGVGNDLYVVDAGDLVAENSGEGVDLVLTVVDYTLTDNTENLYLYNAAINGTGNSSDNFIVVGNGSTGRSLSGLDGNDFLFGGVASDTINGGVGDDLLFGDAGNDQLIGGSDNDIYVIDSSNDIITENSGEGTDTVIATANYTLSDNVENLFLYNGATVGTGNASVNVVAGNDLTDSLLRGEGGSDFLYGGSRNDTLIGGSGDDIITGGVGNDQFVFGGSGVAFGSIGIDTIVDFSSGDQIFLSLATFALSGSPGSPLSAGDFATVSTDLEAQNSTALIAYNSTTGNLFYNQDRNSSSGFGTGGQFATFLGVPALTPTSFLIAG